MQRPYFVIDADLIEANLKVLRGVMDRTGCKILLAQKCFSCYALYPLVARYLNGATASGLYEARLCHEEMTGAENHIFSPAFHEADIDEILRICDHIVFNSPRQLSLYGERAKEAGLEVGLRINPECSTQEGHAIYDPCTPGSRLGTRQSEFCQMTSQQLDLLSGLHFHTLCEQNSDDLETTLDAVEEKFGSYLSRMKWINFGGGHHITRSDYDIPRLERCIRKMQEKYGLEVYLEPGEAVALNAGELHSHILEVQPVGTDGITNVIVDTSAACHMPDVIEMPYTPPILSPLTSHLSPLSYRLGGPTCLSGDIIGTYQFDQPVHEGDEIIFGDMAIYSMVKTNTFNGMPLPDIYIRYSGELTLWKRFGYEDFKSRI
ncbi:MAG: carboxynorspermidine decarboxylase [Bacteroidaceae bacterium]|nr:carboxynorspermidine decarboxylase [Bacteroidaceae bacterium]